MKSYAILTNPRDKRVAIVVIYRNSILGGYDEREFFQDPETGMSAENCARAFCDAMRGEN
jgi:hypothetical protein